MSGENEHKKSIIWLASYPKSGNTWLRLFFENLLNNKDEPVKLDEDFSYVKYSDMSPELYLGLADKGLGQLDDKEVLGLRRQTHQRLSTMAEPVVLAKTHAPMGNVYGIPMFYPETTAKAIYIIRNPLDIVESFADHMGYTKEISVTEMNNSEGAMSNWTREVDGEQRYVSDFISSWSLNVQSWVDKPKVPTYLVRYEDLLADPAKEFTSLVNFVGAPFSNEQIQRAVNFSSFDNLKNQENESGFQELSKVSQSGKFFRHGKANRWRKSLSPKLAKKVMSDHKQVMERFGYPTVY